MSTALSNVTGPVFVLGSDEIETGLQASRSSQRRRMVLPIHRRQDALVQRLINFVQPETYIRPHLHPREHAVETIFLYQGSLEFIVFKDDGTIDAHYRLKAGSSSPMIDIEPNIWHSFLVLEPDTIVMETKRGPYDSQLDKSFAEWAPEEGSSGVPAYMNRLAEQVLT